MESQTDSHRFDVEARTFAGSLLEWLTPFALIVGASGVAFLATSMADFAHAPGAQAFWNTLFYSDAESAANDVGSLPEVLIGVLGLTLTVVAIVVQLAAQRYTPKLVDLFLADRVNRLTFLGMVFATVFCIWVIYSIHTDYLPVFGNLALMAVTTVLLTLLLPYFQYVFKFLTPSNIINTIEANLDRSLTEAIAHNGGAMPERQRFHVANGLEQITDIALSAVTQMDRNVALMSIDTLCKILRNYIGRKGDLHDPWFQPNPSQFISISSEFFDDIAQRRIWVEARGFMDLELIFGLALRGMPDAISAIATNTRQVAIAAMEHDDDESAYLCIEYFNTYLRRAINDRNQRAVFSLLYQYRRLAEHVLPRKLSLAEEISGFINYYGQQAMRVGMPFLKIASTMDVCLVLQHGYALGIKPLDGILEGFLAVGEEAELREVPFAHQGVRKAHAILAAYLMANGKVPGALQRIQASLLNEAPDWLEGVKTALLGVTKKKFWEITDRGGINFEYIEPEMKDWLVKFYDEYLHVPAARKRGSRKAGAARAAAR